MGISRKTILITGIILLVGGGVAAYAVWGGSGTPPPEKTTTNPEEKVEVKTEDSPTQPGVQVTTEESVKNPGPAEPTVELSQPQGSFVSNHRPSLSSSSFMNSLCRTTAGANCEIRFSKGGETKVLGPNKVGSSGFVSWDWKLQDVGLTVGTWQVEAVASSGGKELATKDSIPLEVQP